MAGIRTSQMELAYMFGEQKASSTELMMPDLSPTNGQAFADFMAQPRDHSINLKQRQNSSPNHDGHSSKRTADFNQKNHPSTRAQEKTTGSNPQPKKQSQGADTTNKMNTLLPLNRDEGDFRSEQQESFFDYENVSNQSSSITPNINNKTAQTSDFVAENSNQVITLSNINTPFIQMPNTQSQSVTNFTDVMDELPDVRGELPDADNLLNLDQPKNFLSQEDLEQPKQFMDTAGLLDNSELDDDLFNTLKEIISGVEDAESKSAKESEIDVKMDDVNQDASEKFTKVVSDTLKANPVIQQKPQHPMQQTVFTQTGFEQSMLSAESGFQNGTNSQQQNSQSQQHNQHVIETDDFKSLQQVSQKESFTPQVKPGFDQSQKWQLVKDVVAEFKRQVNGAFHSVRIPLTHEKLGSLDIKLNFDKRGRVNATFKTQSREVYSLLAENRGLLEDVFDGNEFDKSKISIHFKLEGAE